MRLPLLVSILVLGDLSIPLSVHAQWQPDGTPVCLVNDDQQRAVAAMDGAGGAIIAWHDYRNSPGADIYVQRVGASGVSHWAAGGVALCMVENEQRLPEIVSDDAGGAIIVWSDYRYDDTADIFARRVNTAGVPQWAVGGVAVCTAANWQQEPSIVADGEGGAIITWHDYRGVPFSDIYAQRLDASGAPLWMSDGVPVCTAAGFQYQPAIASDGTGGAIIAWVDQRNGLADIYAQRISAAGTPQWTADGVALSTAANGERVPVIISDGASGAIVAWEDFRNDINLGDIYYQRVSAAGVPWVIDGLPLCTANSQQIEPTIVSDGAAGAIVTWVDYRNSKVDIYAQRVNALGVPAWTPDGVAVCTAAGSQNYPKLSSDNAGGAIVSWYDLRDLDSDIYAQRVDDAGVPLWTANGEPVCTAASAQLHPTIVSDGADGAIVAWEDARGTSWDIYAQHATGPPNAVAISSFDANAQDGVVTLRAVFRSDLGVEAVNVYRGSRTDHDALHVIDRIQDFGSDRFEYVDHGIVPDQMYIYQIGVVDADGEFFSPIVMVSVPRTAMDLAQNRPNPFNPETTIRFVLPVRERVSLTIYDTNGRLIRTLVDGVRDHGAHEVAWDGRDDEGVAMGSGVYFYRLRAGKHTESKKMVLLK